MLLSPGCNYYVILLAGLECKYNLRWLPWDMTAVWLVALNRKFLLAGLDYSELCWCLWDAITVWLVAFVCRS